MQLDWSGTAVDTRHDAEEEVDGRGVVPVVHDQSIRVTELRLVTEVGVADDVGVALSLPLRMINSSITYLDSTGEVVDIVADGIHHRDETLVGLADPWVLAHLHGQRGRWSYDLRGGLSVPLGATEEDPFRLGDLGMRHQHVQFGTGTFNPLAGAQLAAAMSGYTLRVHALTQQVVYQSSKGYQSGDRYASGVTAASPLGSARWRFEAGASLQAETAERWGGLVQEDDGNRGRVDVLIGGRAARALGGRLEVNAGLDIPVLTHVVGGQLDYPIVVSLGLAGSFELGGHAHGVGKNGHAHGDHEHHDSRGSEGQGGSATSAASVDVVDLTRTGEAVDLDPVAGKVTVFDFWAPWCAPCLELEAALQRLARRHPGRLAIRRINIVDWESPAAARHLIRGQFALPHLKVTDAGGSLRIEKSAPPADLVRDLERLLAD